MSTDITLNSGYHLRRKCTGYIYWNKNVKGLYGTVHTDIPWHTGNYSATIYNYTGIDEIYSNLTCNITEIGNLTLTFAQDLYYTHGNNPDYWIEDGYWINPAGWSDNNYITRLKCTIDYHDSKNDTHYTHTDTVFESASCGLANDIHSFNAAIPFEFEVDLTCEKHCNFTEHISNPQEYIWQQYLDNDNYGLPSIDAEFYYVPISYTVRYNLNGVDYNTGTLTPSWGTNDCKYGLGEIQVADSAGIATWDDSNTTQYTISTHKTYFNDSIHTPPTYDFYDSLYGTNYGRITTASGTVSYKAIKKDVKPMHDYVACPAYTASVVDTLTNSDATTVSASISYGIGASGSCNTTLNKSYQGRYSLGFYNGTCTYEINDVDQYNDPDYDYVTHQAGTISTVLDTIAQPEFGMDIYDIDNKNYQEFNDNNKDFSHADFNWNSALQISADERVGVLFNATGWTASGGITQSVVSSKLQIVVPGTAGSYQISNNYTSGYLSGSRYGKLYFTSDDTGNIPITLTINGRTFTVDKTNNVIDLCCPNNITVGHDSAVKTQYQIYNTTDWAWGIRQIGAVVISGLVAGKTYTFEKLNGIRHTDNAKRNITAFIDHPFIGAFPGDSRLSEVPNLVSSVVSGHVTSRVGVVHVDGLPVSEIYGADHYRTGSPLVWYHSPLILDGADWIYPNTATAMSTYVDSIDSWQYDRESNYLTPGIYSASGTNSCNVNWNVLLHQVKIPFDEVIQKASYYSNKNMWGRIWCRGMYTDKTPITKITLKQYKLSETPTNSTEYTLTDTVYGTWLSPSVPQYTTDIGTITAHGTYNTLTVTGLTANYTGYTCYIPQYYSDEGHDALVMTITNHNTSTGVLTFGSTVNDPDSNMVGKRLSILIPYKYKLEINGNLSDYIYVKNRGITHAFYYEVNGKGLIFKPTDAGKGLWCYQSQPGKPLIFIK